MYVRRHPELWLWMHRRWRDDGPAMERRAGNVSRRPNEDEASGERSSE